MRRTGLLAAAPLMVLPVLVYNLLLSRIPGGFGASRAHEGLTAPLFRLTTAAGGVWPISAADLLLAASLLVLFIELIKPTASRRIALANHILSMLLFVACLLQLLLAPGCATSTYFLITMMVLLDVLAGFMVTVPGERRRSDLLDDL